MTVDKRTVPDNDNSNPEVNIVERGFADGYNAVILLHQRGDKTQGRTSAWFGRGAETMLRQLEQRANEGVGRSELEVRVRAAVQNGHFKLYQIGFLAGAAEGVDRVMLDLGNPDYHMSAQEAEAFGRARGALFVFSHRWNRRLNEEQMLMEAARRLSLLDARDRAEVAARARHDRQTEHYINGLMEGGKIAVRIYLREYGGRHLHSVPQPTGPAPKGRRKKARTPPTLSVVKNGRRVRR